MSFVPITDLLTMNAESEQFKAVKNLEKSKKLDNLYKKTKDPTIKNLIKEYGYQTKKNLKNFEIYGKLAKDNLKEINDMIKKNKKILVS